MGDLPKTIPKYLIQVKNFNGEVNIKNLANDLQISNIEELKVVKDTSIDLLLDELRDVCVNPYKGLEIQTITVLKEEQAEE